MSRTPDNRENIESNSLRNYGSAWKTVNELTSQGKSWSGHERNCCFLNLGSGQSQSASFADIAGISGFDFADDGRGLTITDWDNDGDLDIWTTNRTAPQLRFLRNDFPQQNQFIGVQLVGSTCNRDAIGARVEVILKDIDLRSVQTVRAGDGFISQSSKRLIFGLGDHQIENVIVSWPDGSREEFADLAPNQKYVIVQGIGHSKSNRRPNSSLALKRGTPKTAAITDRLRYILPSPYPLEDGIATMNEGNSTLLLLWSPSCSACMKELDELSDHADAFKEADISILALQADAPDGADDSSGHNYPYSTGIASDDLLRALQECNDDLFDVKRPLPLPCSFLIDSKHRLCVLYKGTVAPDQVVNDSKLGFDKTELLWESLPYPGQWQFPPKGIRAGRYIELARKVVRQGHLNKAITLYEKAFEQQPESTLIATELGDLFAKAEKPSDGIAMYRRAVAIDPDHVTSWFKLGTLLVLDKQLPEAKAAYREVLKRRPEDAETHSRLAVVCVMLSDLDSAEQHFREAARQRPSDEGTRNNLAKILLDRRKYQEASKEYFATLKLPKPPMDAAANLSWILATAPNAEDRNAQQALRLADTCARATKYKRADILDKLAAAQAANGQFQEAVKTASRAKVIAASSNNPKLAKAIDDRLQLYKLKQEYRSPD